MPTSGPGALKPLCALAHGARLTVLVLGLTGCMGGAVDAAPGSVQPVDELQRLIGTASCTRDADCRSTPVGQRACGGPERYVAWSVRVSDETLLNAAIARETAGQVAANAKNDRMSTCVFVPDPGARCVALAATPGLAPGSARCVLGDSAGASGAR